MRLSLWLGLLACLFFRLTLWRNESDFTQSFCNLLCGRQKTKPTDLQFKIKGITESSFRGEMELRDSKVLQDGVWRGVRGTIVLSHYLPANLPENRWVELNGILDCSVKFKNFYNRETESLFLKNPRTVLRNWRAVWGLERPNLGFDLSWGFKFRNYLKRMLSSFPNLSGIVWAVWTGETAGLDPRLVELYRKGGLLPLIALSGQHVSVMVLLMRAGLTMIPTGIIERSWFRKGFRKWLLWLPVWGGLILTVTSHAAPSVLRTLAMACSLCLLRLRRRFCSTTQLLCSSSAFLIFLDPNLVASISFVLSFGGTFLLVDISQGEAFKGAIKKYFLISVFMSFLSMPLVLFYFGQWSYLAPLATLAVSWLWSLAIIPFGFLVPFLGLLPTGILNLILKGGDSVWHYFVEIQLLAEGWLESSYETFVRPTIVETIVMQISCLLLLKSILSRFECEMRRSNVNAIRFDFFRQKVSNYIVGKQH